MNNVGVIFSLRGLPIVVRLTFRDPWDTRSCISDSGSTGQSPHSYDQRHVSRNFVGFQDQIGIMLCGYCFSCEMRAFHTSVDLLYLKCEFHLQGYLVCV